MTNVDREALTIKLYVLNSKLTTEMGLFLGAEKWLASDYEKVSKFEGRSAEEFLSIARHASEAAVAHGRACATFGALAILIEALGADNIPEIVRETLVEAKKLQIRER